MTCNKYKQIIFYDMRWDIHTIKGHIGFPPFNIILFWEVTQSSAELFGDDDIVYILIKN